MSSGAPSRRRIAAPKVSTRPGPPWDELRALDPPIFGFFAAVLAYTPKRAKGCVSVMDPVERLLAIEEIKQLKAHYFWTVDTKDWTGLAELFTDDAVFDMTAEVSLQRGADAAASMDTVVTGGRAIAAFVAKAVAEPLTVHHGHMPVIEITGRDTATGRWSMYDDVDHGDRRMRGHGWYDEEYRRVAGRWRISRLDLHRRRADWTSELQTLVPPP